MNERLIFCFSHFKLHVKISSPKNEVEGDILESPWLSVCPWTKFCPELFSDSFAHTALKFIHNVCVHMKLCICNFHDHLSLVVQFYCCPEK